MVDLRTPKGTVDYDPTETKLINKILETATQIYKKHGATTIDTPTFELTEILLNKYGDDSKLVFDLKDQGGDICSLRYDLTVSFARYLAQSKIQKIKRYQFGKVFRRDQPSITKGRYREFYQCDFDIAGRYDSMTVDSELIKIASECMEALVPNSEYKIFINHRKIHSAVFEMAGIDSKLHNTICSTIDKKNKISRNEMVNEFKAKGVEEDKIPIIEKYINYQGKGLDFLKNLIEDKIYSLENGKSAIDDLILLYEYCEYFQCEKNIVFDFSLARGTDYYTGIIFECVYDKYDVGTVIGGGRYDNLVRDFVKEKSLNQAEEINNDEDTRKNVKMNKYKLKKLEKLKAKELEDENYDVPCIGFSIGVARIFSILKNEIETRFTESNVFVGSAGGSFLKERMKLLSDIWAENISAETYYTNMNTRKQASFCIKNKIPIMVILGEDEILNNFVSVAPSDKLSEKEKVKREDLMQKLKEMISDKYQNQS